MGKHRITLAAILALALAALVIIIQLPTQLGLDLRGGSQITLEAQPTEQVRTISPRDLEAVLQVIQGRVNGLGVSEAVVQPAPPDKLLVQLPGVSDPARAERVLGGTAQLEFRAQSQGTENQLQSVAQVLQEQQVQASIRQNLGNISDEELAELQADIVASRETLLELFDPAEIGGDELEDARAEPLGMSDAWQVAIVLDGPGGEKFAEITKNLAGTGRSLGIFLDDELISAPTIDISNAATGIAGGRAVITGNFNAETAKELEVQLRGGALPFPVEVVEKRTVGATLGDDAVVKGKNALLVAIVLIFALMIFYYRGTGAVGTAALTVNLLFLFARLSAFGATLTLPGIAGLALTVGMAVDANIIQFERIREELALGKTVRAAVDAGFDKAFSAIFDANVTTFLAAVILQGTGSGPIKGFGVTLMLGVLINTFTAIVVPRLILDYFTRGRRVQELSI